MAADAISLLLALSIVCLLGIIFRPRPYEMTNDTRDGSGNQDKDRRCDELADDLEQTIAATVPHGSSVLGLLRRPWICSVLSGLSVAGLFWFGGAFDIPLTASPVARAQAVERDMATLRAKVDLLAQQVNALSADSNEVYLSSLGTRIQAMQQWACKLGDASLKDEAERLQRLYTIRTKTRYPDTRCPEENQR